HNAVGFDRPLMNRHGILLRSVYDTMIKGPRLREDIPGKSLKNFLLWQCSVALSKEERLTDWSAPVLSTEQLTYAARDVIYLHTLLSSFQDLENAAMVNPHWDIAALARERLRLLHQRKQIISDSSRGVPDYFRWEAEAEAFRIHIEHLLTRGVLPVDAPFGRALHGGREMEIDPQTLLVNLDALCSEEDSLIEMKMAISRNIRRAVDERLAKYLLLHPDNAILGFTSEREVENFLAKCRKSVQRNPSARVKPLMFDKKRALESVTVDPETSILSAVRECSLRHKLMLEAKRDVFPKVIVMELQIKNMERRIGMLMSESLRVKGSSGITHYSGKVGRYSVSAELAGGLTYIDADTFESLLRERAKGLLPDETLTALIEQASRPSLYRSDVRSAIEPQHTPQIFEDSVLQIPTVQRAVFEQSSWVRPGYWPVQLYPQTTFFEDL
ncbi:MAG: hypothetical protein KDD53_03800, partial [Bdellovibrionales bacterium]|nr:hypothetical protein [Bdellovibrionales bacterium]